MQFVLFTDNLSTLDVTSACQAAKHAGFDGLDLTLRPGGHVLPENAEMGLASARQVADANGMSIPMISTAVNDVESPHAEAIFAAAAHYGVRRIKLGYWAYRPFGTCAAQIDKAKEKLAGLVRLGAKYNVLPCVHVHSGRELACSGTGLFLILRDFKPGEVGAYVDPMHMSVEGGNAGWEIGLDLLAPWIALVGIKNFRWVEKGRDTKGQLRFFPQYVPLADGQAPLPEFVSYLRSLGYDGIVSFHSEYTGGNSFRSLSTSELLAQSKADLAYFKTLLQ
ncbi:MAG: TIM barrel protein [Planctomycetota bacterium]